MVAVRWCAKCVVITRRNAGVLLMAYHVGDRARCTGEIRTTEGVLIDPAAVYAVIRPPVGNLVTYHYGADAQLVRASLGVYYFDLDLTMAGKWFYKFYSTGSGMAGSGDKEISVISTRMA